MKEKVIGKIIGKVVGGLLICLMIWSILSYLPGITNAIEADPLRLISPGSQEDPSKGIETLGEMIDTLTPSFKWERVPDVDRYALYIGKYPYGPSNLVYLNEEIEGDSDYFELPSGVLQRGMRYRWNMRLYTSTGRSDISNTLYFRTSLTKSVKGIDVSHYQNEKTINVIKKDINWSEVYDEGYRFAFVKATEGAYGNVIITLLKGEEGEILDNPDNNIFVDGHHWWYVKFYLEFGDYVGWCAEEGLGKRDSNPATFKPGDKVKIVKEKWNLREIHEIPDQDWNDGYFRRNMENATKAGLLVGAYHFAHPESNGASTEAKHFLNVAGEYIKRGYLRPVLDLERGEGLSKEKLSEWIHEWMKTVRDKTNVEPILYTSPSFAEENLSRSVTNYDLWIAHFTYDPEIYPWIPTCDPEIYPAKWDFWDFWQWSNKSKYAPSGSVPGIEGDVDLDIFNGDISKLKEEFVIKAKVPIDVILLTDISGSMDREWKNEVKLDSVKKAAKTFLDSMDKTIDTVGLVSFASSATVNLHLTNDLQRAKNIIDVYSAGGETNIGDALTEAVNEIKTNGRPEAAKAIIFLTDGNITIGMSEGEVLAGTVKDAAGNGIRIYSLGYGAPDYLREEFLMNIAKNTGGKYYYVPSPEELENIYLELSGRIAGLTLVQSEKDNVHQDETITLPFLIDATIDMFRAILNWGGSDLDLRLKNPSGEYVGPDANKVRYSGPDTKPEWYEIVHPELGTWAFEIYGKDVPKEYETFTMRVMASTPITLSVITDRATYDGGEPVLITAELKKGVEPIPGTNNLFVEITMPDSSSEILKLYDDGTHEDINPGDGIYTNSFLKTHLVGIYEVKASAIDDFTRVDTTSFRILTPPPVVPPCEVWNRTFGGRGVDHAIAVIQTLDRGYAFAGWTTSYGKGRGDAWLVKTDYYGNEEWNKTFGGNGSDDAASIILTSDGGYAIAGHTESPLAPPSVVGPIHFWLLKTDFYGNVIWSKTFNHSSFDDATSAIQTSDRGYAIAGFAAGVGDALIVKTDSYGNKQWSKLFGGYSLDSAASIIQTSDEGYAIAGCTMSYSVNHPIGADAWLLKLDRYGTEQWNKTYGGYKWEEALSIIQTSEGGYAIAGRTYSYGAGSSDFWLVKTDCYGNEQWNKTFGCDKEDEASSIIQTSDGGYVIAGQTKSFGADSSDGWLVKTDCYGNEQWNTTFGGYDHDGVRSVIQTSDGGYVIAGWTGSYASGNCDAWLIKLGF